MNKFRQLTNKKTETIKTSKGIVDFTPTFDENDKVKVVLEFNKCSNDLKRIFDLKLKVDFCKVADLGDIVCEVLYLKKTNDFVSNPYLVEHFKLCK